MGWMRYLRLYGALARFGLATEMAFRANFLVKVFVELLWLAILLIFYLLLFDKTDAIAGWDRYQYLFFVGCHYALAGIVETFFLTNCLDFAELIRTGDLDHYLLKPIDEQFLVSCRNLDWSTLPNIVLGVAVMGWGLYGMRWSFDPWQLLAFVVAFLAGVGLSYSFLLVFASTSVWIVRNQSLMELWWLFTTLMRYPREIYQGRFGGPFGWFFTWVIPVIVVVNVPAASMVRLLNWWSVAGVVGASLLLMCLSRVFFRFALARYRSASS